MKRDNPSEPFSLSPPHHILQNSFYQYIKLDPKSQELYRNIAHNFLSVYCVIQVSKCEMIFS